MLVKTRGIVIKQTKFSDSGIIVNVFTEELGMQAFFVRGINNKKSKSKAAMFQPLTLVDMIVSFAENKTLHSINEVSVSYAYVSITENMIKRTLLFFIDELLYKSLKEEPENRELFNWIRNALIWLDLAKNEFVNFHIVFMMQLTMFLGFYPENNKSENKTIFDMQEGKFCYNAPVHPYYTSNKTTQAFIAVQATNFENITSLSINSTYRKAVLETLTTYYKLHIPAFGDFKSIDVLSVILE